MRFLKLICCVLIFLTKNDIEMIKYTQLVIFDTHVNDDIRKASYSCAQDIKLLLPF